MGIHHPRAPAGLEDGGVALVDLRRPGMLLAEQVSPRTGGCLLPIYLHACKHARTQRPHATRTGVVRVSASAGVVASSSALLLASGGDDGGVAVTPIDEQAGDEGSAFDLGDRCASVQRRDEGRWMNAGGSTLRNRIIASS